MSYGAKKSISFAIVFVFVFVTLLSFGPVTTEVYAAQTTAGKTITVKQDGSGNYTSVHDAVYSAQPGDTVVVYGGTYRETVTFLRGGTDEASRITLKAAPGEKPILKGSDVATGWEKYDGNTYKLVKPNSYFGDYNPFATKWPTRNICCGNVYINDMPLEQLDWKIKPKGGISDVSTNPNSWYKVVDDTNTTIYANFNGLDPNTNTTEIHVRKQVINAVWNQGYITIDGLTVMHGSAWKGQGFWKPATMSGGMSVPLYGAISTSGGHHWNIQNCIVKNNRGVAIDYGLGSFPLEEEMGGEPEVFGYHKILNNVVRDNGTNGIMAYKGPYTEIAGNKLINNNTLNTTLLSEAYWKDVDGGEGTYVHDNYFYSNQAWKTLPIWADSECNNTRISRNVFAGPGLSDVMYEANLGYNLMDNNIFIGVGISIFESSHTYMVHNLFLDIGNDNNFVSIRQIKSTPAAPAEGWDGVSRTMALHIPDTLEEIDRFETKSRFNKMFNNVFYTSGLTADATEPATFDPAWPAYTTNATTEIGTRFWGNEVDYNVYYNGANKINNYASAHNYTPDEHSAVVSGNTFSAAYDENHVEITINVDPNNTPANLGAPKITGSYLGAHQLYKLLGYDVYAPDVTTDFFGNPIGDSVVVGPFANLKPGANTFKLWPDVTGVQLDKQNVSLKSGATQQINAAVTPDDGISKTVTWYTYNPSVATVSVDGLVTAKEVGTTTIRATSVSDAAYYADCTVTVYSTHRAGGGSVTTGTSTGTSSGTTTQTATQEPTKTEETTKTESPAPESKPSSASLKDVKGHWAESAISKIIELGAIDGYADGSFKPDNNITRGEFIKILVKAFKLEQKAGTVFTDTANHWAKDYISTANAYGIVNGYEDSTFGPDDLITREQMVLMLVKAVKLGGTSGDSQFTDESKMSSWAKAAIDSAKESGIIGGYPDGSFKPQANATRGEAVMMLVKALDKK